MALRSKAPNRSADAVHVGRLKRRSLRARKRGTRRLEAHLVEELLARAIRSCARSKFASLRTVPTLCGSLRHDRPMRAIRGSARRLFVRAKRMATVGDTAICHRRGPRSTVPELYFERLASRRAKSADVYSRLQRQSASVSDVYVWVFGILVFFVIVVAFLDRRHRVSSRDETGGRPC